MTLYAHTTGDTIDQIGALPALWLGPTRWHDWRGEPAAWATQPADWGWQPVTEVPRPADTETHTSDPAPVALIAGIPTQQWTVRPWTAEELAARAEQAARFDSIEERLARIEAHLWPPADPPADVPTMADYAGVWPAGQLLLDGGKVWRNTTSVPLTTAPSGFPGGGVAWIGKLFVEHGAPTEPDPEPDDVIAWAVGQSVAVGDKRTHAGRLWSAKIAHTTHAGWEPSAAAHAVWTDLGPA